MPRRAKIVPDYGKIVRDNYDRAITIDSEPMDGPRHLKNTAFQARRHKQIGFLQELWPQFFPNHPIATHAELADILGVIKTDSVGDALYVFEEGARRQHIGRGVVRKDKAGKVLREGGKEDGKILRTKRKIDSMPAFLKTIAREMFGETSGIPLLPSATVRELAPLSLPSPRGVSVVETDGSIPY